MAAILTDVARQAGVSLATASRAFGEPGRLAPGTLERVLRAAQDLGYEAVQPSTAVRTFGIVVPDLSNAVFASLIKAVHNQSWHGRHRPVLFDTDEDQYREREQIERARALDGFLLCSPRLPADTILELAGDTPFVVINRVVDGAACVVMDAENGLRQAVEHLAALGHRHIAWAAGPVQSWADGQRADAIAAACERHGIRLTRHTHHAATIQGGRAAAAAIVASGASAVIAYNDLVALGVQAGAAELGKHCPADLSIVGIDDIDVAAAMQPGLTTVRVAIQRSGSLAVEMLLGLIAGSAPREAVHLDSQLIVRASTAPAADETE